VEKLLQEKIFTPLEKRRLTAICFVR